MHQKNTISMCAKCKSERPCGCGCTSNLAMIQEEFYPFDVIKVNCDDCEHVVSK